MGPNKRTPGEAAEELAELALKLGSSDNVTIVIVKLLQPTSSSIVDM